MDELTEVAQAEEDNRRVSIKRLGDTISLAQDFFDAHSKLMDLLGETKASSAEALEVTAVLLLAVRYQLVIGALAVLRAQHTDAMQTLRRAVELAAFAHRMHAHPELRDVWMRAENDDETFRRYRKEFKAELLFPKDDALLQGLYDRYRRGSGALHSSVASLSHRLTIGMEGERRVVVHNYFEFTEGDAAEPARTFLYLIDTHLGILRLFTKILGAQLEPVKDQWTLRMNALSAKLNLHVQRWAPTFSVSKPSAT